MTDYPEHERLKKISDISQQVGYFIEWLNGEFTIAKWKQRRGVDVLVPAHKTTNEWLADYFDIDLDKIEEEKRQMLAELRTAAAKGDAL